MAWLVTKVVVNLERTCEVVERREVIDPRGSSCLKSLVDLLTLLIQVLENEKGQEFLCESNLMINPNLPRMNARQGRALHHPLVDPPT